MKTLAACALAVAALVSQPAAAQTSIHVWGVVCFTEAAAVASAEAFNEGGLDLQDEVIDHMVNVTGDCARISEANGVDGFVVYNGPVVGEKRVVGIAPDPHAGPVLFGLFNADDAGPPDHIPQDDEA